jgi:hypothetical protein
MSFNAKDIPFKSNRPPIEPLDAGTYPGRVVGVVTLGEHVQEFKGEIKAPKINLGMIYEFLDEFLKDEDGKDNVEKPRWLTEIFPFHSNTSEKAKSTQRYTALDQKLQWGWDFSKLVGLPCSITVVQDPGKGKNEGRIFNKITNISAMRPKEADKAPALVNPAFLFDFDEPSVEAWAKLPEWLQLTAKKAINFPGSKLEAMLEANGEATTTTGITPPSDDEKEDW